MKTIVEMQPITRELNICLADDDKTNCLIFKEALEELPVNIYHAIVHDGEQLLELIAKEGNMPCKNGFAALGQIKRNDKLIDLPFIVYSTANDLARISKVFREAADYYIHKPNKFSKLKVVIYKALKLIVEGNIELQYKKILC